MPRPFSEAKRQEWKELVQQWKNSDQKISMAHWCHERNVNYDAFLYWKKRFHPRTSREIDRSSFKELLDSSASTGITLEYHQIRIELAKDFDKATLTRCLRVLKEDL